MEHRQQSDRRRQPRGGRRATDRIGFTPLVFVVDHDVRQRDVCEAILAKLRFAVAPFSSADAAVAVMSSLRPEVVVASSDEYTRLRDTVADLSTTQGIPLVLIPETGGPEAVIDAIRSAIRTSTGPH